MTIGPRTPREQLLAETAHAQGLEEGVRLVTEMIRRRGLAALKEMEQADGQALEERKPNGHAGMQ